MTTRNVSVLILINKGRILLQKRSVSAKRFPNCWGLFGGGVEGDETPEQALKREIIEELELVLANPKFLQKYPYILSEKEEQGDIWVYKEEYKGDELRLCEGAEMKWVDPSEINKLDMHPIYLEILKICVGRDF